MKAGVKDEIVPGDSPDDDDDGGGRAEEERVGEAAGGAECQWSETSS